MPERPGEDEPQEIGAIIRFGVKHEGSTRMYRFAAIKGRKNRWFTTGHTCPEEGWTWADLINMVQEDHHPLMAYYDVIWPVPTMSRVYL